MLILVLEGFVLGFRRFADGAKTVVLFLVALAVAGLVRFRTGLGVHRLEIA